ncbi:hypothetical protein ID850_17685, partial [Xenorhabdus sp. Flor]|nr:hypothetical protein [Xenorhabdus sp. Flor]
STWGDPSNITEAVWQAGYRKPERGEKEIAELIQQQSAASSQLSKLEILQMAIESEQNYLVETLTGII